MNFFAGVGTTSLIGYNNTKDLLKYYNASFVDKYTTAKEWTTFSILGLSFKTQPTHLKKQLNQLEEFIFSIVEHNDKFISLESFGSNGFIAKIDVGDNNIVEMDKGSYKCFVQGRNKLHDFIKKENIIILSPYIGSNIDTEFIVDNFKVTIKPTKLKMFLKALLEFKDIITSNQDEFICIADYNSTGIVAKIKLHTGGFVNLNKVSYNNFTVAKDNFLKIIKNENIKLLGNFTGMNNTHLFLVCGEQLNFLPNNLKKAIESKNKFIETIKKNNDTFINVVSYSSLGFILQIKTFDGVTLNLNYISYKKLAKSRKYIYTLMQRNGDVPLSPYISIKDKMLVNFNCKHKPTVVVPDKYKAGQGCVYCSQSRGERVIQDYLTSKNIDWIKEYTIKTDNVLMSRKSYDIYIPQFNLIVEIHGLQHYEEVDFFGNRTLKEEQENDKEKKMYALQNNYNYLVVDYREHIPKLALERFKKQFKIFVDTYK